LITKSGLDNSQILGVGLGVPGITDVEKGLVFDAPSLGWKQYPLVKKLGELLSFPVYVDNDVNVAALGEQWKGAGKDKRNILQITLGTGVGCGMIINGQLYRGSSFAAGEIGYMVTDRHAAEEAYDSIFSGYGFLDSHVGGPSITKRMLKHLGTGDEESDDWPAKKIFEMAIAGDENALNIVQDALSHLGFALINVISIVNPECVIIGGGLSKSMHHFLPDIKLTIDKHLPIEASVTITTLEDVAILGAAYLVLKEH
ncbi:ROK family protein, partial [Microvirga sp. 3-52]|nr:ROK family protein [Microvirga sp. 3-52]